MSEERNVGVYIEDILESISKIEEYVSGISEREFELNIEKQDAVIRRLEIIGEAVKHLPESFRKNHPDISLEKDCRDEGCSDTRVLWGKGWARLECYYR